MAKKILLAEDSVTMQKVFQLTFAAEDVSITAVSSGQEAIARAREMKPDLVIADLSMTGKTGYDVCAELKADPKLAAIPVVLLHGPTAGFDDKRARAVRADGDLAKPFETQLCIDKVKAVLAAPVAAREPREPMGPVQSLAPPIDTPMGDVVIDTDDLGAPAAAATAAVIRPAAPAAPVAAKPAPPPAAARPAAKPAPVAKPAPPPPVAKPAPPAAAKPAAPPPRPAAPPVKPAAPVAAKPAAAPPPKAPAAAARAPIAPIKTPPSEVEITIEAEVPLPSDAVELAFDTAPTPIFEPPKERPLTAQGTMLGIGLPPPPAGMALPVTPPAPAPATPAPAAPAPAAVPPPVRPGEPYEPVAVEAIAKLSREIIEKIVWEVVPDLAEKIIREELDRLVESRRAK